MPAMTTNVLFTAAGRRVSLVRLFRAALDQLGDRGAVIAADATRSAPALHVADAQELIPSCRAPGYVEQLLEICRRRQVALLVPLIDTELGILARNREAFAKLGTRVMVSDPATIAIGQDKRATDSFFRAHGFKAPRVLSTIEIDALAPAQLPVFVKPAEGSSSIGAHKVFSLDALRFHQRQIPDLVVQELITGDEFTIDVYVDFSGLVRCAVPRKRLAVRAGEVSKGLTVKDAGIMALSRAVVEALPGAIGCITLQCFQASDATVTFIEINPRFGGGFPLTAHAGAHYPRWIVQEQRGETPDWGDGYAWRDNLCMLRYDDEIIVDGSEI